MRGKRRQLGVKILPGDVHSIEITLSTHVDIKRNDPDAILSNRLGGQITGAISDDSNRHRISENQYNAEYNLNCEADPVGLGKGFIEEDRKEADNCEGEIAYSENAMGRSSIEQWHKPQGDEQSAENRTDLRYATH